MINSVRAFPVIIPAYNLTAKVSLIIIDNLNPSVTGLNADIGSIALDKVLNKAWIKYGIANNDWKEFSLI